jgi:hypothetical protein
MTRVRLGYAALVLACGCWSLQERLAQLEDELRPSARPPVERAQRHGHRLGQVMSMLESADLLVEPRHRVLDRPGAVLRQLDGADSESCFWPFLCTSAQRLEEERA